MSDTSPQPNHPYIALQKPPLALGAGLVSGGFLFLGIGFALKVPGISILFRFTHLLIFNKPPPTECGWLVGVLFSSILHLPCGKVSLGQGAFPVWCP